MSFRVQFHISKSADDKKILSGTWRFLYGKVRWTFGSPEKKKNRVLKPKGICLFQAKTVICYGWGLVLLLLPALNYSSL